MYHVRQVYSLLENEVLDRILIFCFKISYVSISKHYKRYGLEQSTREVERKQHQIKSGSILRKNVFPLCQLKFVAWVRYFETSCKPHKKLIFLFETCDERFNIIFTVILVPLHAHQTWWCITGFLLDLISRELSNNIY